MNAKPFFRMCRVSEDPNELCDDAYYSCEEIEGAITFVNNAITMCGHVHSKDKGMPAICEYKGGEVPASAVIEARNELIRKNQTDEDTPCKGCEFLKKRIWPKNDHLFDHITVGHYTVCNLNCSYCYRTDYSREEKIRLNSAPYNAADSIKNIISQGLLAPNATAWLTGGEPPLFVDFVQIMEVLLQHNVRTTIGTNCTKYSDVLEKGLNQNLVEILCSVDAGTRDKYQVIKGKDAYDAVWENLGKYAQINRDAVVAKYILMDESATEIEVLAFVSMCKLKGIGKISISRDIRKYRGLLSPEQQDMPKWMYQIIVLMMAEAVNNGIEVNFDINWPVFTDMEILRIKLHLVDAITSKQLSLEERHITHYLGQMVNSLDCALKARRS